jgi:hypothetical protein
MISKEYTEQGGEKTVIGGHWKSRGGPVTGLLSLKTSKQYGKHCVRIKG